MTMATDDLPTLEAWRLTLLKARANPRQKVRTPDGEEVTYRTDAELAAALADVERRIAGRQGRTIRMVYVQSSKGV